MNLTWRHPGVVSDTVDGVTIAIDLDNGAYYQFSHDASSILESLPGISEDVSAWQINGVLVRSFLKELVDLGLLESRNVPARDSEPEILVGDGLSFQRFTDLAHILMLDPIHDVDPPMGWPHADGATA
jgi:hypothetical protein